MSRIESIEPTTMSIDEERGTLTVTLSQDEIKRIQQHLDAHKWPDPMDPPMPKYPGDDANPGDGPLIGQLAPRYVRRGGEDGPGDIVITIGPIESTQPQPNGPQDPKPGGVGIGISFNH